MLICAFWLDLSSISVKYIYVYPTPRKFDVFIFGFLLRVLMYAVVLRQYERSLPRLSARASVFVILFNYGPFAFQLPVDIFDIYIIRTKRTNHF